MCQLSENNSFFKIFLNKFEYFSLCIVTNLRQHKKISFFPGHGPDCREVVADSPVEVAGSRVLYPAPVPGSCVGRLFLPAQLPMSMEVSIFKF
jgi:hypothetical protein